MDFCLKYLVALLLSGKVDQPNYFKSVHGCDRLILFTIPWPVSLDCFLFYHFDTDLQLRPDPSENP